MIEASFLHYRPGNTAWHRHDPRLKFIELMATGIIALSGPPAVIALLGITILVLHVVARTRWRSMKRPLFAWLVLAALMVLALGMGGGETSTRILLWNRDGMIAGALRAARLLVVLLAGQLFASTTNPADVSGALRSLLFLLPRRFSGRVATAVSLTLAFVPLLLDEARTVGEAAASRGSGSRRNPLVRVGSLAGPLLGGLLRRVDLVADALLSRGYVDDPTPPNFRMRWRDVGQSAIVLVPSLALWGITGTFFPG